MTSSPDRLPRPRATSGTDLPSDASPLRTATGSRPLHGERADGTNPFPEMTDADLDRICLHNLLNSSAESVFFKDGDGRYLRVSRAHAQALGADADAVVGRTAADLLPPDEAERSQADDDSILGTGVPVMEVQTCRVREDGDTTWTVTTKQPLRDFDGRVIGTFGITRDITARKLMEQRLTANAHEVAQANAELSRVERELRTMLETSPDPIVRYDRDLRVRYANPAALAMSGLHREEIIGQSRQELSKVGAFNPDLVPAIRRVLNTGLGSEHEYEVETALGRIFLHTRLVAELDAAGAVTGVLGVGRDLTDRKRAEDLLADRAVRDPLTGLANRVLLTDRLNQAIIRLDREPGLLAVLFLDLDRFKVVNDSLGHGAGDALIVEVADRLKRAARRIDTVARFGGDEFVVLCERLTDREDAALIADRITRVLAEPWTYNGQQIHPSASIGIAATTTSDTTAEILVRDADAAMYQAKDRGRGHGSYHFFDAGDRERAVARLVVENELRQALEQSSASSRCSTSRCGAWPTGAWSAARH
jgi:diguanylate cyclase (GGDEF)-like protein/PAS domain S-box-containing protein